MDAFQRHAPLVGRVLIALPLLLFAIDKASQWEMMVGWLRAMNWPAPSLVMGLAIGTEIVGGLMIAIGFRTRIAASVLIAYLLAVHFLLHNFWVLEGAERQGQFEQFFKGAMIIGGLLYVTTFGAGPASLDERSI